MNDYHEMPLRRHYSNPVSKKYLAYGCAHCTRGFFGDIFIAHHDDWDEVAAPVITRVPMDEELLRISMSAKARHHPLATRPCARRTKGTKIETPWP
jgi:hypothetical protein